MNADNPDPTEPTHASGEGALPKSNSSTVWAIVAGLAVVAATFLIYMFMTTSSSVPDAAPGTDASEQSAQASSSAETAPPSEASSVAEPGATDSPAPVDPEASDEEVADDAAQQSAAPELTPEQEAFLLDLQRRDADDVMALGEVDAPVVLIEYSDFRCPYCAQWATQVKPELQSYLDDGTLRIEYHDLALLGPESADAAVAARAAGEQGKYWEYHDALFAATAAGDHPDMPADKLIEMATEVGVPDLEAFEAGLESAELIKAVEDETAAARELGITSTPTFLVNTAIVQGAQPADVFTATVESEAEKAGR